MSRDTFSIADRIILEFDRGLKTLIGTPNITERPNPANNIAESKLTPTERLHAARLMRINHAGEVSAQALYQGQAWTAKNNHVKLTMQRSADEENDHLQWCKQRILELDNHVSFLNPLWYVGSLAIGAIAGITGDKWSLGFVTETEHQVATHLESHLNQIVPHDKKTIAILQQMKIDELHHATIAANAGAAVLPQPIKKLMQLCSKVMTKTAYWI